VGNAVQFIHQYLGSEEMWDRSPFSFGRRAGDEGLSGSIFLVCVVSGDGIQRHKLIGVAAVSPHPNPLPKGEGVHRLAEAKC
jgi:hypothetical protein